MTAATTAPELTLRLPGSWWTADLTERASAVAAAKRLVRHRIGEADDRAVLRARLHRDLVAAIDRAIEGQGRRMLLAIQVTEGLPLPIAITVYAPTLHIAPSIGTAPDRVLDVLERGLREGGRIAEDELASLERIDAAGSRALRTVGTRRLRVGAESETAAGAEVDEIEVVAVDYWIAVPGHKRVVLVDASCSYVDLRAELVVFFDALLRVAAFREPEGAVTPEPAGSADLPGADRGP